MHEDCWMQAVSLAKMDVKKPKQANLRRAISSAYYAVFHLLIDEAAGPRLGHSTTRRHSGTFWEERSPTE